MKNPSFCVNASPSPLPMVAAKRFELLENEAREACADLAQTGERYRVTREEALKEAYASRLSQMKRELPQDVTRQGNNATPGSAVEPKTKDPKIDHFERTIATKKEEFAREMAERDRQLQALQHLRRDEVDMFSKDQGHLDTKADVGADAAERPIEPKPQPGFLRRLIFGRYFLEET